MTAVRDVLFARQGCTLAELDYVRRGAGKLGTSMAPEGLELMAEFLRELSIWNDRFRMVGTRDRTTFLRVHVLDALAPAAALSSCSSLVDIGSGAGLPGIPLSIACPWLTVTLVENRRVRASFLKHVARQLRLKNIRVVGDKVERWASQDNAGRAFDATIARAWRALPEMLRVSAGLLLRGGIAIAMMGRWKESDAEMIHGLPDDHFETPSLIHYALPGGPEQRSLVVCSRR